MFSFFALLTAVDTALVDMDVSSRSTFAFDFDAVVCSYIALVTCICTRYVLAVLITVDIPRW